ncbi:MAG TPA: ABC transporter ATP-binding protein [Stellaceae bacterium]|nr:ABC transporter ATP-binding protein [Stellaceae bacterium]
MAEGGAARSAPVLAVRDLKTYFHQDEGVVRAVDGASLEVHAGRTLGIVGESGCGKSVTARSILRIVERPGRIEGGSILLARQNGSGVRETVDLALLAPTSHEMRAIRGRDIALIFQEPMTSLSAYYTVSNQIVEAIRQHSPLDKRAARRRAIELLAMVGIPRPERRIDEYPFQLSGGLRQRVMIAMALACEPRILIADEPTTALDVTTQAQILDLLRRLQRERGLAIILITHDMGVIAEMADEVVVMYLGRVVERGPVDQIFHAPKHPYTKALLRSIPSILATPRDRLTTVSGSIPHPYDRPPGCPFHPRCPDAIAGRCDRETPQMTTTPDGNAVSCFLYREAGAGSA